MSLAGGTQDTVAVVLADFGNDGDLDIFVANYADTQLVSQVHCTGDATARSHVGLNCVSCTSPMSYRASEVLDVCLECDAHTQVDFSGECATCPPAFSRPFGHQECTKCQMGKSQPTPGTDCVDCSEGTYSPFDGSVLCFPCALGSHSPQPGATSCTSCDVGSYSDTPGASVCSACPVGGFCATAGAASASMTFEQWYVQPAHAQPSTRAHDGDQLSVPLTARRLLLFYHSPAGYYNSNEGASSVSSCIACSAGKSNPVPGSSSESVCKDCMPGGYSAAGAASCTRCEGGKFTDLFGQTACEDCTPGYLCLEGSSAPQPCPGGTHADSSLAFMSSLSECIVCDEGTSCSVGSAEPTPCAPGTYSDEPQQETCKKCDAGTFQALAGQTSCDPCTAGYYCAEGAAAALPCPGGTHKDASLTVMTSVEQCVICNEGTSCSVGSAEPTPCAPGTYTDEPEQETCKKCVAGKFQDKPGNTACKQCLDGHYCAEGAAAALPCPGGRYANQTIIATIGYLRGLDECVICPPGMSCSVGSDMPTPCLPGSFSATEAAPTCDLCPAGEFQNLYGQTSCKDCIRGFYCNKGASTPVPCPGGTSSNASRVQEKASCTPVGRGFWAPLGSALPEPCPASGFYCPGAAEDTVNAAPGSKPIIVPVGDSTTTKEVESVQKEMSLDVSCDDFDINAVKQELAEQYGCDPALISFPNPCGAARRRRALATLTFTITIATEGTAADGTPVTAAVGNLLAAIQAIDDTALANGLGSALGTTVAVTTQPPAQAVVAKTVKFTCPKGKWCTVRCMHHSNLPSSSLNRPIRPSRHH